MLQKVVRSTVIDAPIERVWAVLRDFNSHDQWHAVVDQSRIEGSDRSDQVGCVRSFTLKDGNRIREQLLTLDDREHKSTYCIVEATVPLLVELASDPAGEQTALALRALSPALADALDRYTGHFAKLLTQECGFDEATATAEVAAAVAALQGAGVGATGVFPIEFDADRTDLHAAFLGEVGDRFGRIGVAIVDRVPDGHPGSFFACSKNCTIHRPNKGASAALARLACARATVAASSLSAR